MPDFEENRTDALTFSYAGHYLFVDNAQPVMHVHRGAELVLFARGSCVTRFEDGRIFQCRPGMLLVTPPGLKHIQYDKSNDCETYYVVFEDGEGSADLSLRMIDLQGDTLLADWFRDLYALCGLHEFRPASFLLQAVWAHLMNLEAAADRGQLHPALKNAVAMILRRYREDIAVSELARICSVSTSLLNRLFRKRFGVGPRQFLIEVRMREARLLLLNPDYNIGDVAQMTGFATANYFIRQFKGFHGVTPFCYRQDPARFSDQCRLLCEPGVS